MVTSKQFIPILEDITGIPGSDLRSRRRSLIEAGAIAAGKPGRSGVGAPPITKYDAAMYLLSLAAPESRHAGTYALRLAAIGGGLFNAIVYGITPANAPAGQNRYSAPPSLTEIVLPTAIGDYNLKATLKFNGLDDCDYVETGRGDERPPAVEKLTRINQPAILSIITLCKSGEIDTEDGCPEGMNELWEGQYIPAVPSEEGYPLDGRFYKSEWRWGQRQELAAND